LNDRLPKIEERRKPAPLIMTEEDAEDEIEDMINTFGEFDFF